MSNRHPSRKTSRNRLSSKSTQRKTAGQRPKFLLDALESRLMLTVVTGGDVFEYIDAAGNEVRVAANGNLQADLIAGVLDDQNQIILTDMPGRYFASDVGRGGTDTLGGLGGQDGVEPVTLDEAAGAPTGYNGFAVPSTSVHFRALASNPINGATYGVNVYTTVSGTDTTPQNHVDIVQLNNQTGAGTRIADLTGNSALMHNPNAAGALPPLTQNTTIAATAAAIDPTGTFLYFVAVDNTPGTVTPPATTPTAGFNTPRLYVYNLTDGSLAQIPGTFGVTSATNFVNITAMTFVPGTSQLIGFASRNSGTGTGTGTGNGGGTGTGTGTTTGPDVDNDAPLGNSGQLVTIPTTGTNGIGGGVAVTLDGDPVGNITGLAFVQGDPSLPASDFVMAVQNNGADSQLLRIRRDTGTAFAYGGLSDLQDTSDPIRGQNIQDLTWNPTLTNPFTGEPGVLLGTDVTTDDLLFIDHRLRPKQADLYHINITRSDENASLSIAQVALFDPKNTGDRPDTPFTGNSPTLQVNPAQGNGDAIVVNSEAGTGVVYIGARTRDINPDSDKEQDIPVINGALADRIGSTVPSAVENAAGILRPGLTIGNSTITDFVNPVPSITQRLLGANLSGIQGVATGPPDFIAVMDTDQVDANGIRVANDELALVDPITGNAFFGAGVFDATTGAPLANVNAMAYGDINGDGVNELYAVYTINNVPVLGQLIDNRLSSAYGAFLPIGTIGGGSVSGIQAMTFNANGQTLYMVDGSSRLLQVNPLTGATIANIGTIRDASTNLDLVGTTLSIHSMGFDAAGTLYGQDLNNARLVDISLTDASAGAVSATPVGSLPPTIGAIAFSKLQNRFVGVDNAYGGPPLQVVSGLSNGSSSALIYLTGTTAAASVPLNMGNVLIGGTLTGKISINGSIGTLYAGWLLTGDPRGLIVGNVPSTGSASSPANLPSNIPPADIDFTDLDANVSVGGDLNNLVVRDSIGTDAVSGTAPTYFTGFNVVVAGTTGEIRTGDSLLGKGQFLLSPDASHTGTFQTEVESNHVFTGQMTAFQMGLLNDSIASNDNYTRPQVLAGSAEDPNGAYNIQLRGEIDDIVGTDGVDYYGIPAMAGQLITVQLLADAPVLLGLPTLQLGVFDPDGRLIASSNSKENPAAFLTTPLQFRTDRPGLYRLAVAAYGDMDFIGTGISGPSSTGLALAMGYFLNVSNLGAMSVGGITAANNILNPAAPPMSLFSVPGVDFEGFLGDMGAISAGGTLYSQTLNSIRVDAGNLRAIVAGNIGDGAADPYVDVRNGSIGQLRSTTGIISVNPLGPPSNVGFDIQLIDAFTFLTGNFSANRAMGVIRAGSIDGGSYTVNADNIGTDGVIDLFDVTGEFNGPAITTGPGGNVRYIRAQPGMVTRDPLFGGGTPEETNYDPGQPIILNDDSGSRITIQPVATTQTVTSTTGGTGNGTGGGTVTTTFLPTLSNLLTYPIRGSGGVVLISFSTDGPIRITGDGSGSTATAEIGSIDVRTPELMGTPVILDANGNPAFFVPPPPPPVISTPNVGGDGNGGGGSSPTPTPTPTPTTTEPTPTPMNIVINGSAKVDVFDFTVLRSDVASPTLNYLDNYINSTGGELVGALASTIGNLSSRNVGIPTNHTGAAVDPIADLSSTYLGNGIIVRGSDPVLGVASSTTTVLTGNQPQSLDIPVGTGQSSSNGNPFAELTFSYPLNRQHIGIESGNIGFISASEAIGNILVTGTIGMVQPNSDGRDNPAVFEGIAGPIVVDFDETGVSTQGGGSGSSTPAAPDVTAVDGTTIPSVVVLDPALSGSLITANLGEGLYASGTGAVGLSGLYVQTRLVSVNNGGANSDIRGNIIAGESIGSINLTNGSIINTNIIQSGSDAIYNVAREGPAVVMSPNVGTVTTPVFEIGSINLKGNGGIIGSYFQAADMGPVSTSGFGIISSYFGATGPTSISDISAGGYGIRNSFFQGGVNLGRLNATGNGGNLSTAGLEAAIRQSELGLAFDPFSLRSLGAQNDIHGFLGTSAAAPVINGRTDTGVIEDVTAVGSRDFAGATAYQIRSTNPTVSPVTFNFANSIGGIVTRSAVNGLSVITGKLNNFKPASDVFNLQMTIAGPIGNININGSLTGNTFINAIGPNGTIGTINIAQDLLGTISATGQIKSINVGRNLSGNINILGGSRKGGGLGNLFFGGTITNGALNINGDVGTITSGGSFGQIGDQLTINGTIQKLQVRGDLLANVHVTNSAKKLDIWGSILDGVTVAVDNTINALLVGGNTNPGALIEARVLKKLKVKGANLATYHIG